MKKAGQYLFLSKTRLVGLKCLWVFIQFDSTSGVSTRNQNNWGCRNQFYVQTHHTKMRGKWAVEEAATLSDRETTKHIPPVLLKCSHWMTAAYHLCQFSLKNFFTESTDGGVCLLVCRVQSEFIQPPLWNSSERFFLWTLTWTNEYVFLLSCGNLCFQLLLKCLYIIRLTCKRKCWQKTFQNAL